MELKCELITTNLIEELILKSQALPRRRLNHNFHQLEDLAQRMLNCFNKNSYVCPHRHITPPKNELFYLIRGRLAILLFEDDGTVSDTYILDVKTQNLGIDIKAGTWHTIIALEEGSVVLEVKEGPYVPMSDKDFAPWAPREGGDPQQIAGYLENLYVVAAIANLPKPQSHPL
ncbi:MAG: WbuC family cupin fold metalloprotein [Oligoflexia bacterium]|nr:WbuC family cupin fold metalloprotein [Oligoflexia bacterium]MBF0366646.1 WbuC family cupin fold metalloprotein [Oligoflexia bacterium]